ncbi:hypothetical protein BH11BAC4_BH11BAC4_27210 [soil metagenome]
MTFRSRLMKSAMIYNNAIMPDTIRSIEFIVFFLALYIITLWGFVKFMIWKSIESNSIKQSQLTWD